MRISGGSARGRKVGVKRAFSAGGEGEELRPTSSKVRQAIFDILGERILDADFLDLYAGTGAVGIEALSRGAKRAVFVERNARRAALISRYVEEFGFRERAVVVRDRADSFLKKTGHRFDIAFVDPPYASDELGTVLAMMDGRNVIASDGTVIVEHSSRNKAADTLKNLIWIRTYKYGDSALTLYKKETA